MFYCQFLNLYCLYFYTMKNFLVHLKTGFWLLVIEIWFRTVRSILRNIMTCCSKKWRYIKWWHILFLWQLHFHFLEVIGIQSRFTYQYIIDDNKYSDILIPRLMKIKYSTWMMIFTVYLILCNIFDEKLNEWYLKLQDELIT